MIISLLITSCRGSVSSVTATEMVSTKTALPNVVTVTPSITTIPTFRLTNTPVYSYQINSQCPEIQETLPTGLSLGVVSYWARDLDIRIFLNLETFQKSSIPNEIAGRVIVSPDRNNIAYDSTDPKTFKSSLVVRSLDDHKRIETPWPFEDSLDMPRWQDNSHILFTLRAEDKNDLSHPHPYRNALVNPFTREITILRQDFSHISDKFINWSIVGSVVYDPTLDYAIYAAWDEDKNEHEYVLWHIPSQTQLAALPGNAYGGYAVESGDLILADGVAYNPPVWSTDGSRAVIISSSPDNLKVDDIFAVNKEGEIQQLTKFSNQFQASNLRTLSWSPDGEQIAFFINTEPGIGQENRIEQFAILNTQTGEVSMYCLNGDMYGTHALGFIANEEQIPAPIWSPDGTQLIIENRFKETESRLILLDLPSNSAYEVGQNMQPVGWMISEPQ
jgi:hypothetical protein